MRLALAEATRLQGRTHPNPTVGAVLVRGKRVLAAAAHAGPGLPHAELAAMASVRGSLRGTTLYTTLEPCNHWGRTMPCAQAILERGVTRVVYASRDPNPLVDGKGLRRLRAAGVTVDRGPLVAEADALNRPFFKYMREKLPWVTLKAASTLDGMSAPGTRRTIAVTSEPALRHAHALRSRVDAIVVGADTVLADNPQLTARYGADRSPLRIILDGELRTSAAARVYDSGSAHALLITGPASARKLAPFAARGVTVWQYPKPWVPLRALALRLARQGVLHLLVEGGAATHAAFLQAGLADELHLYLAPKLLRAGALTWSGAGKPVALRDLTVEALAPDLFVHGFFSTP